MKLRNLKIKRGITERQMHSDGYNTKPFPIKNAYPLGKINLKWGERRHTSLSWRGREVSSVAMKQWWRMQLTRQGKEMQRQVHEREQEANWQTGVMGCVPKCLQSRAGGGGNSLYPLDKNDEGKRCCFWNVWIIKIQYLKKKNNELTWETFSLSWRGLSPLCLQLKVFPWGNFKVKHVST